MTVYLVGAGPGDPGLLTVRGADLLRRADVVVYDRLASPALLELAPDEAERIAVGKAPGLPSTLQAEINDLLVARGRTGATVVRLKGGDPFVFGRGGEEAEVLAAAGVPYEVVPGVTSAIAVPAYAGIPVTHRGASTHFTVVTGHEDPTKDRSDVDWGALAQVGGTLVLLMGARHVAEIARQLIGGGLPASTPVTAIRYGTRADQQTIRTTLGGVHDEVIRPPSTIVIGEVAALELAWFESRPLFGKSVVVTRAREQASGLRARLEELGAEVLELPAIAIEGIDVHVPDLSRYEWLVFTSPNGVQAFFGRGLTPSGRDARALAGLQVAAIGPGTARALAAHGIAVDLVPERFVAESLLDAFPAPTVTGAKALLARAEQARDVLPTGLEERGYAVEVLPVYRTVAANPDPLVVERVRAGAVDALTFTSSSTVTNLLDVLGAVPDPQPLVVSIGPVTSATAVERGLRVDAEAEEHTIDGLIAVLLSRFGTS